MNKNLIISVLILLLILAVGLFIHKGSELKETKQSLTAAYDTALTRIKKKDRSIAQQQQVIVSKNSKLANLADSLDNIKEPENITRVKTKTIYKHDTVKIVEQDSVIVTDTVTLLKLPYQFGKDTEWYAYKFTLTNDRLIRMDSLAFKSDLTVTYGKENLSLWERFKRSPRPLVSVTSKNPYTNITGMKNLVIERSNTSKFGLGVHVGYGITNNGLSPVVGVGLNYNIIKF